MFKVQNTLAILTASATMLIMACDGTSTSEEILSPQESEISSSSIDFSSSQDSEISSSLQAAASSSSITSSSQASSSDSGVQITKMDTLPFDTTGVWQKILHYSHLPDHATDEADRKYKDYDNLYDGDVLRYYMEEYTESELDDLKKRYGNKLKYYVDVTEGDGHQCLFHSGSAGAHGTIMYAYTTPFPEHYILMEHEDSLLFTNLDYCSSLKWDACHRKGSEYAYTKKIMVGDDTFYYGEFEEIYLLIQVTDSTVINWKIKNPSYVPPISDRTKQERLKWDTSIYENDTLVTFISDDTIFIEKYNLKITDGESTWIFGDEVCSTLGYQREPWMTDRDNCKATAAFHNEAISCEQRNLNITDPLIYPDLCRKEYGLQGNWCILDETLEERSSHTNN